MSPTNDNKTGLNYKYLGIPISSPCPIQARVYSNLGDKIFGMFFKGMSYCRESVKQNKIIHNCSEIQLRKHGQQISAYLPALTLNQLHGYKLIILSN